LAKASSKASSYNKKPNLTSGVAGAGGGTLIILFAKNLPDSNPAKSWLILAAPTISVIILWILKRINLFLQNQEAKVLQKKLKAKIEAALQFQHLTNEERENLQRKLSEIEMADIDLLTERIKTLNIRIIENT